MFFTKNLFLSVIIGLYLFSFSTTLFSASSEGGEIGGSNTLLQKTAHITDITSHSANVTWGKVDSSHGYVAYYDTKSSQDSGTYKYYSSVVEGTGVTLKNLIPNTLYYLVIKMFDAHANEVLISEEIKFSTINGDKTTNISSSPHLIENENKVQTSQLTVSPAPSTIENNPKTKGTSAIKNSPTGFTVNSPTANTDQLKKLPKTGPASSLIIVVTLLVSGLLIMFFKKQDLI